MPEKDPMLASTFLKGFQRETLVPVPEPNTGAAKTSDWLNNFYSFKNPASASKIQPSTVGIDQVEPYLSGRYDKVVYGGNNEEYYALRQSGLDKAVNAILKGVNLTATTIAGGFGMLYGIAKTPFTHRLADVWDNELTRPLSDWNNKVDQEYLPNYYSEQEKNAAWYSTDNWLTWNFLFDKLIKNSGYAIGAMLSGNIANAGLLRAGAAIGKGAGALATSAEASQAFKLFSPLLKNTSRAFSYGKNVEAAEALKSGISSIPELSATTSKLADIANQAAKFAKVGDYGRKTLVSLYSSAGEASFEGLNTANEFRDNLIEEYRQTHNGAEPDAETLREINKRAEDVGKTSFFSNLGILGITEFSQLKYLYGSSFKNTRKAMVDIGRKTDDVLLKEGKYIQDLPTTKFGKLYKTVSDKGAYVFDPKEALQELTQTAIQVGAQNYYNKAYEGKDADVLNDFFLYGFFGRDEKGKGVGALVSKEGIESLILGGVTGGVMQTFGPSGKIAEQKTVKSNTERFIQQLNLAPTFKQAFKDKLDSANRGIILQRQREQAIVQNDKLEATDLKTDIAFNYLIPRIRYGRFDMVIDDINDLKRQGSTEEGLNSLKQEGYANLNDTVETYTKRLAEFKTFAENTAKLNDSMTVIYGAEILKDGKGNPILDEKGNQQRKYSPQAIEKMVYAATKIADYDLRIPQVNALLTSAGISTQEILQDIIKNNKPNKEATAKALNQINDLDVTDSVKDELKSSLSDVIELSLRRKLFIDEHNDIKNNPLKYEILPGYGYGIDEKDKTPVDVKQTEIDEEGKKKKVEKKLEIGKEYSLAEPLRKDGAQLTLAPKIRVLAQTLGGELEVMLPNGKKSFLTPEQFKAYNISDVDNTSQEMADILDASIDAVLKRSEHSEVKKEMPSLGEGKKLDKVAWVNSLDNKSLVNDIEKEFAQRSKDILEEKERLRRETEQLKKNKEEIDKQQAEIEQSSGSINTGNPNDDIDLAEEESAIPDARIMFISGTSESEEEGYYIDEEGNVKDPQQAALHIQNSRQFLNNVGGFKNRKNIRAILVTPLIEEAYGLKGLTQMSYGVNDADASSPEFKKKTVDVETGFIAQVFVEQVGDRLFFIDKDGKQIGEVGKQIENINNVIFQTMRTTKLTYANKTPRYRKNQKEEAEAYAASWGKERAKIFNIDGTTSPVIYDFVVSRGIANKEAGVTNHIAGVLIDEKTEAKTLATDQTLIQIPTAGVVAHRSRQINMPNGRPVLVHQDNVEFLNNIQFKGKRALAIYEAINKIATEINEQSKAGKRIIINKKLSRFLQNVLYWRKGSTTEGSNQINISEDGSSISFSGKTYSIPEIATKKDEIIEAIEKAFHNVNNSTLSAEMFSRPFMEYYIDENGKLSEEPREWANYQTYLLSSTYPDGSARPISDTPLYTNIRKPNDKIPYTHKQKYATLVGLELPVGVIAKPAAPAAAPQPAAPKAPAERKYDYDGETDNIFTTPFGDVIFTVKGDEQPIIDVESDVVIATRNKIINKLNEIAKKEGQPELSIEELTPRAMEFVRGYVNKELEADRAIAPAAAPQSTAATFTPTTPYGTPTGPEVVTATPAATVSDKKADIEKKYTFTRESMDDISEGTALAKKGSKITNPAKVENQLSVGDKIEFFAERKRTGIWNGTSVIEDGTNNPWGVLGILGSTTGYIKNQSKIDEELAALEGTKPVFKYSSLKVGDVINVTSKEDPNITGTLTVSEIESPDFVRFDINFSDGTKDTNIGYSQKEFNDLFRIKEEETKPAEAPKEPGSFNVQNVKKRGNLGFRKVGVADKPDRMSEADLKAFKEWHAKNVPNIPFEVLENMINILGGEKAWGVFEKGVAKFVRGGLRGTEYHEVGEAIWNGMLSPEEQADILADERKRSGSFVDRESGKRYNYDDPTVTDEILKERILDDFADYRLGKLPARTLSERVRRFFKMIMDFFKSFVAKPSLKEKLFEEIESGKYREKQLSPESKKLPPKYRAAGHLTEEQTNAYVKDMTALSAAIILGNGEIGNIDKSALYHFKDITSAAVFKKIEDIYLEQGVRQELGDKAWSDLVVKTKQQLRSLLKIEFNEEDLININDSEVNKNDYAREPFSVDYKKSAPIGIKFVSATLIEREPTNQEDSNSFKLPKPKVNPKTQTYSLLDYGRVFSTMLDKLKNTTSVKKVIDKLINLANRDANYVSMFQRLGGNIGDKTIDFSKFKFEDWRLFIEMMQTYTKQKPDAIVQYISQGQVYSGSAMVTGIVNKTTREWIQNLRSLSKEDDSIIKYDSVDKTYSITDLSEIPSETPLEKVKFLEKLGIIFPIEAWEKLKESQQKEFTIAVATLKKYLQEAKEIMNIQKKTLDVAGHYDKLAQLLVSVTNPNQETTRINLDGKQTNSFTDNNTPSIFENEFNEVANIDELLALRPELLDVFSTNGKTGKDFETNSQILKLGGPFFDKDGNRTSLQLKVGYIEGTLQKDDNKGKSSKALGLGDRFTQEINQNLIGYYYIMIPADGSTEWMMNLGNHVSFEDVEQGTDGWRKVYKIFKGYLNDDIALALDSDNRQSLRNVKNRAKELRFFKDILPEKILSEVNDMIEKGLSKETINNYIEENIDAVNQSVKEYIESKVDKTIDVLKNNNQIEFVKRDEKTGIDYYKYKMLNDDFVKLEGLKKNQLTEDDVRNIITFANINYEINNVEFHKFIFGDPYQFEVKKDGSLDATKRFKSFFSPRRTTFDTPEFNTFLNDNMNNAGDVQLQPGDPGYHQYKAWIDTVTVDDVIVAGSVSRMENLPKEIRDAFAETKEADAASIMMDTTYRELKMKNHQWDDKGSDEAWHQWEMAWTRLNLPKDVFEYPNDERGRALKAHDEALVKTKKPKHVIEVVKPIVSGVKHGSKNINLVLDKFSQMPLYYSMVKGTNLGRLYEKMFKEKKGYIIMLSGRKVGAENLHPLYKDGMFNNDAFNNNVEVSWKSYGIQVENTYENKETLTRGSQLTKLSTLDLYENGEPIGDTPEAKERIAKEVKRNNELLDKLHQNGYDRLLKRLGIEDLNGSYNVVDRVALAKALQNEMFRRELSDNVGDTIQLDENQEFIIPFEASPAYLQIKSILYSFIDKEITAMKMTGGSYVQTPVTLWENADKGRKIAIKEEKGYRTITRQQFDQLTDDEKKNVILTDDTLKFYEDTDNKRYCEVMLPYWFKGKLGKHANKSDKELIEFLNNDPEGRKILSGIGFRIPTQSISSVEVFVVKGFLPQYMGKTVVVPSEITTKAGSDFDIDKLNMYLKAVYVDAYGQIKMATLKGTEEETKNFYGEVFDEKLKKQTINKAELLEAVDIFTYNLPDPKGLVDKYMESIEDLMEDVQDASDISEATMKKIENLNDQGVQAVLRQEFVDNMYRKSLENEYYISLQNLLSFPENFKRLISPVGDDGLKDVAKKLDKLRKYDESKIKNRLLDRNYMTSLRHAFILGKKWIGIAAVNITGQSLTQKIKAYIDPERFKNVSPDDQKILRYGNGEVLLDHNTIEKDGKRYVSLSGRFDTDGKFISDGLSGFATSFVDVAKDPYILKIIKSDLVVSTFMFLRRIGVPKEQLAMFMNQPIIDEYLTMLDGKGVKDLFRSDMIAKIQQKFPTTITERGLEGFNLSELESNIETYYEKGSLSDEKNFEQQNIFQEFLKYAKMAEYNFNFTQATNYDTTKFRSGDTLALKQWRTENAEKKNIISSVNELLESSFIGKQAELLDKSMDAMGEILPLEKPEFTDITDEVLQGYYNDRFLSKDKFDKIANKLKASFLDYIIQKRSDISTQLERLLVDEKTSVARMLVNAKKEFPDVKIIQDLEIDGSGRRGGAETVKLKVNDGLAYNENMYTGMMRELRDDPRTNALYKGIVKLAILQGIYKSPISINNIIPVEDYAAEITPIISGLRVDEELRAFAKTNEFQRNEWKDNDIVPIIEPRFTEIEDPRLEAMDEPRQFQAALVKVGRSYLPGAFPTINELNIKSSNRQILLLNTKYQAKATNYDVVKVPRSISIDRQRAEEGKIDVKTGLEITNQMYAEKIKKGDTSLKNFYGYQKVKYADGSPVIAGYDAEKNPIYVYKFINLHGDGMYAKEYYGDGRPSVFNNGTEKNVRSVEGTIVSNEIPDQTIINYYGGESVPMSEATPITATVEKETAPAPPTSAPSVVTTTPVSVSEIEKETKDIINKSNLEPGEYEVVEIGGKQRVIDKRFIPKKVKRGYSKFYSSNISETFSERYGKRIVIPGFEDINLMLEQDTTMVYELSTGLTIPTIESTQKLIKEELKELFNKKDVRKLISEKDKIDLNNEIIKQVVPTQTFTSSFSNKEQETILTNFIAKHPMTKEDALKYINNAVATKGQTVIDKLKECYL